MHIKEMAYVLGVSVDTLNRNYRDVIDQGKSKARLHYEEHNGETLWKRIMLLCRFG